MVALYFDLVEFSVYYQLFDLDRSSRFMSNPFQSNCNAEEIRRNGKILYILYFAVLVEVFISVLLPLCSTGLLPKLCHSSTQMLFR